MATVGRRAKEINARTSCCSNPLIPSQYPSAETRNQRARDASDAVFTGLAPQNTESQVEKIGQISRGKSGTSSIASKSNSLFTCIVDRNIQGGWMVHPG